jgi:hypothetical protein
LNEKNMKIMNKKQKIIEKLETELSDDKWNRTFLW